MQVGVGYEIWNDSSSYSGEYKNGKKNGIGYYIWPDGTSYKGEWKNNNMEGFGIYYWPNNRIFIGFWKEGKQNGVGKYIKDDIVKYGIWKDGKREKWFENEEEFLNSLDSENKRFIEFFQWVTNKIKKYFDLDDNSERGKK